ncbi:MAG: family 20 glycosylhydrolase [Bacteroidales bacterium]|nr:family 20 glycosylhydrolase [Bacteroidales bacterium]
MNKTALFLTLFLFLFSCQKQVEVPEISIIPKPVHLKKENSYFKVNKNTQIYIDTNSASLKNIAGFLVASFKKASGFEPEIVSVNDLSQKNNFITFKLSKQKLKNTEAYTLKVDKKGIIVEAETPVGLFYGLQTIYQLMPPEIFSEGNLKLPFAIQAVSIIDYPRFSYRGMHLDVSRHFFSKEFIKKYIDLIALHKMNTFHWHLVDDQGWRVEIKKYPKLTEIGAWRVNRNNVSWRERPPARPGEKATYGGFYTQDDIREIVKYAQDRYITIIPEIEMPAHVLSAIAAYPYLSCTGDSISVPTGGIYQVNAIYCAGRETTFEFLENVLSEVMELFPSHYIHIGGDEANKEPWKKCSYCQKRIKNEGLKNVEELQSYFIKRIEKFLIAHGRELIGWDEILEGGLAPEATVMSWRGIAGGITAAQQGHDVIMTPGEYCYFNHYQGDPRIEPEANRGYTTLKKVYAYEPVPKKLNEEEGKHILGAQANVWTEFILSPEHVEYMVLPRMAALAEVVWSPKDSLNWDDFNKRVQTQFKRYECLGLNYSKGTTVIEIKPVLYQDTMKVELYNERYHPEIHYTLDGTEPTVNSDRYQQPINVSKTLILKAALFENGKMIGLSTERLIAKHKALGAKVHYLSPYKKYTANDSLTLSDGMTGSYFYNDGFWQGFYGTDMEVVLTFPEKLEFTKLSVGFFQKQSSWIFLPKSVAFYVSDDGENFSLLGEIENDISPKEKGVIIKRFVLETGIQKAKYLKVKANALINCPEWHRGAGNKAWVFADEITVD